MNVQTDYLTQRSVTESHFTTSDHTSIFYRYYQLKPPLRKLLSYSIAVTSIQGEWLI